MTAPHARYRRSKALRIASLALALCCALASGTPGAADGIETTPQVVGDGIAEPLASPGDPGRGRALLLAREPANCLLCHAIPALQARFSGDVGPSLAGVGSRLSPAQLRLRIADSERLDPDTRMPGYYRVNGLHRVALQYRDRPILSAGEVEDLVAYLATLR